MGKKKTPIQKRLLKYGDLLAEINVEEERGRALINDGSLTYQRAVAGIEDRMSDLLQQEQEEYEALTKIINALPRMEQRQVMLARYIDGQAWDKVTAILFSSLPDYNEKTDSYKRRTHRIHGKALVIADGLLRKMES